MSFKDKILNNQSPWGTPPGGDGGRGPNNNGSGTRQDPPSLDDLIKNFQKTINKFSGGKSGGSRPIILGLIIALLIQMEILMNHMDLFHLFHHYLDQLHLHIQKKI